MIPADEREFQIFAPNRSALEEAKEKIEELLVEQVKTITVNLSRLEGINKTPLKIILNNIQDSTSKSSLKIRNLVFVSLFYMVRNQA